MKYYCIAFTILVIVYACTFIVTDSQNLRLFGTGVAICLMLLGIIEAIKKSRK